MAQRSAHPSPCGSEAGPPRPGLGGSRRSQLLTLRSSSRSRAELLASPGPLEGMAGSWAAGGRLGLRGAGGAARLRGRDLRSLGKRGLRFRHRSGRRVESLPQAACWWVWEFRWLHLLGKRRGVSGAGHPNPGPAGPAPLLEACSFHLTPLPGSPAAQAAQPRGEPGNGGETEAQAPSRPAPVGPSCL